MPPARSPVTPARAVLPDGAACNLQLPSHRADDGSTSEVTLLSRIDTPIEVDYYRHGGILPFVLRDLLAA